MSTLKDVAREAGVSKSTASRFFNEPAKVKDGTREKIKKAVQVLDYRPSRVARRLRVQSGRTHLLGLAIPDIQNPFHADVARGVESVVREHEYSLILENCDEDPEKQRVCLSTFENENVDGVIVPPVSERDEAVCALIDSGMPVVCVDRRLRGAEVDTVVSDNRRGAYEATHHLIEAGHARIAYLGGIKGLSTTRERYKGYRDALDEHGIAEEQPLVRYGQSRLESGRRLTNTLMDLPEPPTALFAGNNLTLLGAYVALRERGARIPDDMAVVGYDDVSWASALAPPPTVVSQSGREMGRRAAEMLLRRMSEPESSITTATLRPKLVVRDSCDA
jgi:LacI family transcriptional regulator/LacI family repressor for deo operon, udp, cdd, tsx, nupC, and nupG